MRHMNIVTSSFLSSTSKVYIDTKVAVHPTTKFEGKNWKPTKGSGSSVPVPAIAGGIAAAALISVIVIIVVLVCRRKRMRNNSNEEFGNQDLNGQLHQDENEPPENGFVHQITLQPSFVVQTKVIRFPEAIPDYANIPHQTKSSEMSSKENSAAAGSSPSCSDPEYEKRDYEKMEGPICEWDYEKMEGPIYQELQNRPWNSENCDYAKLVFQIRNQTLSPMQVE